MFRFNLIKCMLWFENCDSTMDICHRFASFYDKDLLIGSSRQLSGRGTKNRVWESPKGNLYLSFLLFPQKRQVHTLHMIAALSVIEFLNINKLKSTIKWPNDIMINGEKISGILQENVYKNQSIQYSILGIGLNLNMDKKLNIDVPHTSVKLITSNVIDEKKSGNKISRLFSKFYFSKLSDNQISSLWKKEIDTISKEAQILLLDGTELKGKVLCVDNNGDLVLKTKNDNQIIKAGMVKKLTISK